MTLNVTTTDLAGLALDGTPGDRDRLGRRFVGRTGKTPPASAGDVGGTDSRISFNITAPSSDVGDWQVTVIRIIDLEHEQAALPLVEAPLFLRLGVLQGEQRNPLTPPSERESRRV
jgi:hypothetical protein